MPNPGDDKGTFVGKAVNAFRNRRNRAAQARAAQAARQQPAPPPPAQPPAQTPDSGPTPPSPAQAATTQFPLPGRSGPAETEPAASEAETDEAPALVEIEVPLTGKAATDQDPAPTTTTVGGLTVTEVVSHGEFPEAVGESAAPVDPDTVERPAVSESEVEVSVDTADSTETAETDAADQTDEVDDTEAGDQVDEADQTDTPDQPDAVDPADADADEAPAPATVTTASGLAVTEVVAHGELPEPGSPAAPVDPDAVERAAISESEVELAAPVEAAPVEAAATATTVTAGGLTVTEVVTHGEPPAPSTDQPEPVDADAVEPRPAALTESEVAVATEPSEAPTVELESAGTDSDSPDTAQTETPLTETPLTEPPLTETVVIEGPEPDEPREPLPGTVLVDPDTDPRPAELVEVPVALGDDASDVTDQIDPAGAATQVIKLPPRPRVAPPPPLPDTPSTARSVTAPPAPAQPRPADGWTTAPGKGKPQVIPPAAPAAGPTPEQEESGKSRRGMLIGLAVLVVVAAVAIGGWFYTRSDPANQVADAVTEYQDALAAGDLDTLRSITCGENKQFYDSVDPEAYRRAWEAQRASDQMLTFDRISAVQISSDGSNAVAQVNAYYTNEPSRTTAASIQLQKIGDQWKVCDS